MIEEKAPTSEASMGYAVRGIAYCVTATRHASARQRFIA